MGGVLLMGVGVLLVYVATGSDLLDFLFRGASSGGPPPVDTPGGKGQSGLPAAPGGAPPPGAGAGQGGGGGGGGSFSLQTGPPTGPRMGDTL